MPSYSRGIQHKATRLTYASTVIPESLGDDHGVGRDARQDGASDPAKLWPIVKADEQLPCAAKGVVQGGGAVQLASGGMVPGTEHRSRGALRQAHRTAHDGG